MKISFVILLTTIIMGCSNIEQNVRPEPPVVKVERKVVIKKVKRNCAPIPSLENVSGKKQFDEWVLKLVTLYKECAK